MDVLEKTEEALQALFERYTNAGIRSMYIWGSVLTPDFDPQRSDIDVIAIADDVVPTTLDKEMTDVIHTWYSDLGSLKVKVLYISELNGGHIKGGLASVIFPKALLFDLPNWRYVAGEHFSQEDFQMTAPSCDEVIQTRLLRVRRDHWEDVANIPKEKHQYFLKLLARIIDLQQKKRGDAAVFSYTKILNESERTGDRVERQVARAIAESRDSDWNYNTFQNNMSVFQSYLNTLLATYTEVS